MYVYGDRGTPQEVLCRKLDECLEVVAVSVKDRNVHGIIMERRGDAGYAPVQHWYRRGKTALWGRSVL